MIFMRAQDEEHNHEPIKHLLPSKGKIAAFRGGFASNKAIHGTIGA
jgi:hypothetical protein